MTPTFDAGDGYPLSIVELTRWNRDLSGCHFGCPRHRSPQPLVAGTHETTADPIWICTECGYATPILDDELNATLGATVTFTDDARNACMRATTRYVLLPSHPASNANGTARIADRDRSRLADIGGGAAGAVIAFLLVGLFQVPGVVALSVVLAALVLGAGAGAMRRKSRTRRSLQVSDRIGDVAANVLPGQWISRDAIPHFPNRASCENMLHEEWREGPIVAPQLDSMHRACRVLQNVRIGNTSQVRISTTAGVFTTADTTRIGTVVLADPELNDFTYHPRG